MAGDAPVPVCPLGATLGEGPVWLGREQALYCVDIKQRRVHRFDPASGRLDSRDAPDQVGWVLPARSGGFVAGLKDGLHRLDFASGRFTPLGRPPLHPAHNRLNDAAVDPQGRLWFGTMDDDEAAATGRLFRFADSAIIDAGLTPVAITNGPAIAPDGRTLYHTDTLGGTIAAVPVHDDGTLGTPRPFVAIDPADGHPDGAVADSAGNVWTGLYGGCAVRCYAPDGALLRTVAFPTANVTKLAFGGPDLCTAYATTARKGLDPRALAAQPHAGDIFAFPVDVPGLPTHDIAI